MTTVLVEIDETRVMEDKLLEALRKQPGGHTLLCLSVSKSFSAGTHHVCTVRGKESQEVKAALTRLRCAGCVERIGAYYFFKRNK